MTARPSESAVVRAARELCDLLLIAAGCYATLLNGHPITLDDGGGP